MAPQPSADAYGDDQGSEYPPNAGYAANQYDKRPTSGPKVIKGRLKVYSLSPNALQLDLYLNEARRRAAEIAARA